MTLFTMPDIVAVACFCIAWAGYSIMMEYMRYGRDSLSARMDIYREVWVRRLLDRDVRVVDSQIMSSLQNGTAFFASTTLLAVGGSLTFLKSSDEALTVLATLPFGIRAAPALWEIKCIGLVLIFVYAFFKFVWAYRLFNYVAIMLGAMPFHDKRDTPEAQSHVIRTTRLFQSAGRHFNSGQRAFLFALGYLGWFVSPWILIAGTIAIVVVMWRRQFHSDARHALLK